MVVITEFVFPNKGTLIYAIIMVERYNVILFKGINIKGVLKSWFTPLSKGINIKRVYN
jgi:hypothetical protein